MDSWRPYLQKTRDEWNADQDGWYKNVRSDDKLDAIQADPSVAFHADVLALMRRQVGDLSGKKVLVPSSGDNHAVYAFHLMGAQVTSSDLSDRQLQNAEAAAKKRGWDIRFVQSDTMQLSPFGDGAFDLVYTSNGVHVWIDDLCAMYRSIARVLAPGGRYLLYDIHPFTRPFQEDADDPRNNRIAIKKPYGVRETDSENNHHWRLQDLLNAMAEAGLIIERMEELFARDGTFWFDQEQEKWKGFTKEALDSLNDWRVNPLAALPQLLCVCARKPRSLAY